MEGFAIKGFTPCVRYVIICGNENYIGTRNKKKHPDKMVIKKYCPKCNQKTDHKEKK